MGEERVQVRVGLRDAEPVRVAGEDVRPEPAQTWLDHPQAEQRLRAVGGSVGRMLSVEPGPDRVAQLV